MDAYLDFIDEFVMALPGRLRLRALDALTRVVHEARAEERRRLCTDARALERAHRLTARELEAQGAQLTPTERSA